MISDSLLSLDGKSICRNKQDLPFLSSCIDDYIQSQIKCKVPWISNNNTSLNVCTLANQTVAYLNISKKVSMMRDAEVAAETGCHIPCKRNEYTTK